MDPESKCAWCQPMTKEEMQDNPNVTHGQCPRCIKIMEEEFREYYKKIEEEET